MLRVGYVVDVRSQANLCAEIKQRWVVNQSYLFHAIQRRLICALQNGQILQSYIYTFTDLGSLKKSGMIGHLYKSVCLNGYTRMIQTKIKCISSQAKAGNYFFRLSIRLYFCDRKWVHATCNKVTVHIRYQIKQQVNPLSRSTGHFDFAPPGLHAFLFFQMYASESVALTFERNAFCVTVDCKDFIFQSTSLLVNLNDVRRIEIELWGTCYPAVAQFLLYDGPFTCADGLNANGTVSVLNTDRLGSVTGPVDVIHGYAVKSDTVGQLTVHLQTVPVPAPCK